MSATHRVIHIGDLHLGPNARQADRLAALDLIIETASAKPDLALWAIPGDLFHAKSSIEDRNELAPRLQRMADIAPVVMVYGNHDEDGDLELLTRLQARHPIVVHARPVVDLIPGATGHQVIYAAIPYPKRHGLVAAGVESGTLEQTGSQAFEVLVIGLAAALEERLAQHDRDDDGPLGPTPAIPLVFGHFNKAGARASTGQPQIGREIELSDAALQRFPRAAAILLNHIHRQQDEYAGSVCRMDYGEIEPKGYIEITYLRVGDAWQYSRSFIELPVPPMYHVEGNLTRDGFTFVCATGIDGDLVPTPTSWKGIEVRCRYTFLKAEIGAIDKALIHAEFAEAKSLKLDPVPVHEQKVRAPEVAAAVTLEDKVRACCAHQRIDWTPGLADKLAALRSQDPATVLAGVIGTSPTGTPNAATNQPELAEVQA